MSQRTSNVLDRPSPGLPGVSPLLSAPAISGRDAGGDRAMAVYSKQSFDEMLDGRMGRYELAGVTVTSGLLLATSLGAIDVAINGGAGLTPRDVLLAIGYFAVSTVPATVGLVTLVVALLGLLRWRGDRRWWTSTLTTLFIPILTLAVFSWLSPAHRFRFAMVAGLVLLPLTMVFHVILSRRGLAVRFGGMIGLHLVVLQSLLVGVCGAAALSAWLGLEVTASLAWIPALAILYALGNRVAKGIRFVIPALLLSIPISTYGFYAFGSPTPMRNLPTAAVAGTKPTNVVLIVLDTTRRDHLGAYGDTRGLTPYLDKLASEGAVYEQAITPGPWTIPSHASIFTGWFPLSHGCSNEHRLWLDDEFTTLAEMLGEAGYQSLALNSNFYLTRCNLLQGFDKAVFLEGPYDRLGVRRLANLYGAPSEWVDKGSGEAVTSLSNWLGREYDPGKPLFLFVNLFEGHRPYIPPRDERHAQLPTDVSHLEAARFATTFEPIPYHIRGEENESAQRMLKPLYEALIRYQDRRLEEFMGILSQRINLDDTLVIVTADHGENLGEAGRWEHIHAINENLIHVPLIVRQPARFPAGTRVPGLCQTVDILPTVFDVIDRDCPVKDLPGRSLVPDTFQPREAAFAQVSPYTMHFPMIQMTLGFEQGLGRFNAHRRVIRTGSMKYIWSSDGRHELFDITHDPQETQDLIQSKPDVATELDRRLSEWWKKQPAFVPASRDKTRAPEPLTLEAIEQLRSLGYVGGG